MKQKKKLFNLRLFFIGFVGMMLGILTFYHLLNILFLNKVSFWFVLFSLLFVGDIVLIIYFSIAKQKRHYLKFCIIFILLFAVGFGVFSIRVNKMLKMKTYDEEVEIDGIVNSYYYDNSNYIINLKKVVVNGEDSIGNVKLYVVLDSEISKELSVGDRITSKVELSLPSFITDKINITRYIGSYVYSGYTTNSAIRITNLNPNLIYSIQERLKYVLDKGLSNENSNIAYSVLIGDKDEIDESVSDVFSYAGISHILAVSGLHVGFLVTIITFILNLCRIGRRTRFFTTSIILLFYCMLCNFTPSVLRATFMTIVLLLAGVLGEEYDGLNSLCFAGIMILLIFPQDLFSLGFQLSFMCVFMIITLADKMTKLLNSWKVPNKTSSAISISLCVTLGSSIILANSMYEVSIIGIISNLIVIPLFSLTYPLLFVIAVLAMLIPFLSKLLFLPEILLHLIKLFANSFAEINFAHFRVFHLGYMLLFIFILLSIFVKFFMCGRKVKTFITFASLVICIIIVIIGSMPIRYNEFALYTNYQYSTNSSVITTNTDKKFLINIDEYSTNKLLIDMKIVELDGLILQDFEVNQIDDYIEFLKVIKVNNLVIPKNEMFVNKVFDSLNEYTEVVITDHYEDDVIFDFVKTDGGVVSGTEVKANNKTIFFTNGITKVKLEAIGKRDISYDYIITNQSKYDFTEFGIETKTILHSNDLNFSTNDAISLKNKSYYVLNL